MQELNFASIAIASIPALATLAGAAIIVGKQLQTIAMLTERVQQLESTVSNLSEQVVRLTTLLDERTAPRTARERANG